ncbi:MAG: histidinol-phosphate transaminase [Candidatus Omnitrophica bacterium]|nr:histidinol-phosphate transaminase [Candidatus Omnitrophota bacterium]
MFRKDLVKIKAYKPGRPIEEVKRALGLKEVYKLASNEVPFAPNYIKKAILKEVANVNRYPEGGCFYLRRALAKQLKVDRDQIVFGNGSDELIVLALEAFIQKGDEIVVAYPTFLIYELQGMVKGAKVRRLPLKDFRYDLDAMAKAITNKTKIVFIANPDNPGGTYLNKIEVEQFLKKIPKNVLVFLDEAYFEFAPSNFPKSLNLLKKRGNIIVTRTFSKAYGLAGLRIGYGVTTKKIADILNKIREPFNVDRIAQVAAIEALKNKDFLNKVLKFVKKEKQYLYNELKKLKFDFIESATNFVLINLKKDTASLNEYLLKEGVIIRELRGWGLNNFFRVTVGLHKENVKFIKCLKSYMCCQNMYGKITKNVKCKTKNHSAKLKITKVC